MKNITNITKITIVTIALFLLSIYLTIGAVQLIMESNKEYKKYLNLSIDEKIIYNCTKDTIYYSGDSNEWPEVTQNHCIEDTIAKIN